MDREMHKQDCLELLDALREKVEMGEIAALIILGVSYNDSHWHQGHCVNGSRSIFAALISLLTVTKNIYANRLNENLEKGVTDNS